MRTRDLLTPEAAILFAAAGPPARDADIRAIAGGAVAWPKLLWLAARERATPVVWRRLERLGVAIPTDIRDRLRQLTMIADFTAARLEARLSETLASFASAGVEVALLKGAALVDAGLVTFRDRPMGDLDILVHPGQAAASRDAALEARWAPIPLFEATDYGSHHHLPPMADPDGAGRLEIHTDLFVQNHPFGGFVDALWRDCVPSPTGRAVRPSVPYLVLHACLHLGWSHAMEIGAWRTFADLGALVTAAHVDWNAVHRLATRFHAERCCYWALHLGRELAGLDIPEEIVAGFRPRPGRLRGFLSRHFAAQLDLPEHHCPSILLGRRLWCLAMRQRGGPPVPVPWELQPRRLAGPREIPRVPGPTRRWMGKSVTTARYLRTILTGG